MKVALVTIAGLNPTMVDTLKYLAKIAEVEIVGYGDSPARDNQNRRIFESEGITFNHITKLGTSSPNRLAIRMVAHILRSRPDVVVPIEVYYRHSFAVSVIHRNVYPYAFQNIILKRAKMTPLMKRLGKLIVPVPSTAKVWVRQGFPASKIYVIPFGVDPLGFKGAKPSWDMPRILYVGRLVEEKGLTYLLRGLSHLKMPFEAKFVGAGKTAKFASLASSLKLGGKLQFVTFVERDRLHEFYNWSNIFVMPSLVVGGWAEQLGMALIEAMAYGRAVIGTRTGAIPDVIGDSGILVNEKSETDIAKAIEFVVRNPDKAAELSQKARSRVLELFDAKSCAERMYNTFVGRGKPFAS